MKLSSRNFRIMSRVFGMEHNQDEVSDALTRQAVQLKMSAVEEDWWPSA